MFPPGKLQAKALDLQFEGDYGTLTVRMSPNGSISLHFKAYDGMTYYNTPDLDQLDYVLGRVSVDDGQQHKPQIEQAITNLRTAWEMTNGKHEA